MCLPDAPSGSALLSQGTFSLQVGGFQITHASLEGSAPRSPGVGRRAVICARWSTGGGPSAAWSRASRVPPPQNAHTHPQAAEVVEAAADERARVRQQHLDAQVAAQAVETVEQRAPRAQQQQQAAAAQRLLAQGLDAVVGEAERQQQRGQHDGRVRAVQAAQPQAAQARERALERVQEGAAQHGPEQRPQEGLEDEVHEHRGPAAQAHEQHRARVVESLFDGLIEAQSQRRRTRRLARPGCARDPRLRPGRAPRARRFGSAATVGHRASAWTVGRGCEPAEERGRRRTVPRGLVGFVVPILRAVHALEPRETTTPKKLSANASALGPSGPSGTR